jgi:hypothetical protein
MNGWSNTETWMATMWGFADDLSTDDETIRDILEDETNNRRDRIRAIADHLESQFDEFVDSQVYGTKVMQSILGDFIATSVSRVDWYEIAESWYEDNVTEPVVKPDIDDSND